MRNVMRHKPLPSVGYMLIALALAACAGTPEPAMDIDATVDPKTPNVAKTFEVATTTLVPDSAMAWMIEDNAQAAPTFTPTPTATHTATPESPTPAPYKTPVFEVVNEHTTIDCLNAVMDVFIDVFGIYVISTQSAPRDYVVHTANILAEFIDNDLDGVPDDPAVLAYLLENNYVVPVWTTEIRETFWERARGTFCEDHTGMAASMYYDEDEWAIGGIKQSGTWDVNLEEVWHVVSRGWYGAYPEAFGNDFEDINKTSLLREAMNVARGGRFDSVPSKYPAGAWYKYHDASCRYQCQVSEYFYWALMANIGALDPKITDKCHESSHEWNICTRSELEKVDKRVYNLLNNPEFRLPRNIPQGKYKGG
mgnify:FL=1